MHHKRGEKYLVVAMVASMFLWGLGWPSGKVLTRYCSAVNFTVYRYAVVVAALFVILISTGVSFRVKKAGIPVFLVSGLLLAFYSYVYFLGLKYGSAGAGGVLVTTLNPIFAYALGVLIKRRMPSGNEIAGLALGIAASCVLLKVWDNAASLTGSGNVYFLLAAFTWALMSKFTATGARYGSSMGFSLWQYLVTLLCLVPFLDFSEINATLHIRDSLFWLNLVFSSVIVTAIATTVFFYSTTRIGAEKASSFIFLVPLGAAISSWLFLGENIRMNTIIGGLLGIAAVYIMNKRKGTETSAQKQGM